MVPDERESRIASTNLAPRLQQSVAGIPQKHEGRVTSLSREPTRAPASASRLSTNTDNKLQASRAWRAAFASERFLLASHSHARSGKRTTAVRRGLNQGRTCAGRFIFPTVLSPRRPAPGNRPSDQCKINVSQSTMEHYRTATTKAYQDRWKACQRWVEARLVLSPTCHSMSTQVST
jgi:hypothetical protein